MPHFSDWNAIILLFFLERILHRIATAILSASDPIQLHALACVELQGLEQQLDLRVIGGRVTFCRVLWFANCNPRFLDPFTDGLISPEVLNYCTSEEIKTESKLYNVARADIIMPWHDVSGVRNVY